MRVSYKNKKHHKADNATDFVVVVDVLLLQFDKVHLVMETFFTATPLAVSILTR